MGTIVIWRFHGLNVQIMKSHGAKWYRSSTSAVSQSACTWHGLIMWHGLSTERYPDFYSALTMNVLIDQSHKVSHDPTWKLQRHLYCKLLVKGGPWGFNMGGNYTNVWVLGGMVHWGELTVFGDLLSQVLNHLGVNNTNFLKIFSPLSSEMINREAVLGQYENQLSHSRVRWETAKFIQVARVQGDHCQYARAGIN